MFCGGLLTTPVSAVLRAAGPQNALKEADSRSSAAPTWSALRRQRERLWRSFSTFIPRYESVGGARGGLYMWQTVMPVARWCRVDAAVCYSVRPAWPYLPGLSETSARPWVQRCRA